MSQRRVLINGEPTSVILDEQAGTIGIERPAQADPCRECGERRDDHPLAGLTMHHFGNTMSADEAAAHAHYICPDEAAGHLCSHFE